MRACVLKTGPSAVSAPPGSRTPPSTISTRPIQTPHRDEITFTGDAWEPGHFQVYGRTRKAGAAVGHSSESALTLEFTGNRVEVTPGRFRGECGTAKVLIDGRPPSENPRLYVHGRISNAPGAWWPAIRRVDREAPLLEERWTVEITEINESCTNFTFRVEGSATGFDGTGESGERFVSDSGRVVIEPGMWTLASTRKVLGGRTEAGFEVTWEVVKKFVDTYAPQCPPDTGEHPSEKWRGRIHRVTLASGLSNGPHVLEVVPNGDGPLPVGDVIVHEPPLK
jgi:hypothetical protein